MLKTLYLTIIVFIVPLKALSFTNSSTQRIMEEGMRSNEALIGFLREHQCEFGIVSNCDKPLSGHDLAELKELFLNLESWRKNFENLLKRKDMLKGRSYTLKEGKIHTVVETIKFNPRLFKNIPHLDITLSSSNSMSSAFVQNITIATASTLLMYDSFFKLSELLSRAKKIRYILEYDMGPEGNILHETFSQAMDKNLWNKTRLNLGFLNDAEDMVRINSGIFDQYISKSFTASHIQEKDFSYRMTSVMTMKRILSQNMFLNAIEKLGSKLSQFFGNTIGKIQTRQGKLKQLTLDPLIMKAMKKKLKPLDIFFEKTPFRLTDYFIPGFYGHVAIWLGRPEELMEMTVQYQGREILLLDHPLVLPYLEDMSQGKLVLEALRRPGVTLNKLEDFLDVDDFLVLKPSEVRSPGEHVLRAIEQIGKPYDFAFDVETESSIVCSELVYTVFRDQDWPTARSMGRYTISPDHVAWKALDSCFSPKIMYHEGIEVTENRALKLKRLLELKGGISYTPTGNCY